MALDDLQPSMTFQILPGLPASGPPPLQFTYGGKRTHSEGIVVEFTRTDADSWVGNFQKAIGQCSAVLLHPDDHHVVVVAAGQGYVIDPVKRTLTETFGGGINGVWELNEVGVLVFDDSGVTLSALAADGWRWRTKRISWDGFHEVDVRCGTMTGNAWKAIDQRWQPFSLNLATGAVQGGAYLEFGDQVI